MAVHVSHMVKMIREGMDHYWRVVYSKTDDGLNSTELGWKRDHERSMDRMKQKYGPELDRIFGKAS